MALEFLNYQQIRENNKEFTRSDLWKITFVTIPACYYPGNDFIDQRCTGISPGIPNNVGQFQHQIRGFSIHQATVQQTSSQASLTFVDREDMAIRTWIEEWKQLMADRDTLKGNRKETYTCDIEIMYYNTSRVPLYKLTLYNCMLTDASPMEDGTNEATSTSDITMSLAYEHFERTYLNR